MEKRWKIREVNEAEVDTLQRALNVNRNICRILIQRGLPDYKSAETFFNPSSSQLHDPFLMKDMAKAVNRISEAITKKEKILVFGDYDVDGTTAVACMFRFLSNQIDPSLLDFYIPHRYLEGYGISKKGIEYAADNNFTLIISLDCGIKSIELITYAANRGIDFIVCDHHLPDSELPPAVAILNPKQSGCEYPYKELCGCGVGFKLITALIKHLRLPEDTTDQFLDLVATAIAADIVPMTGENRTLVSLGLKKANENPNHGIRAIKNLNKFEKDLEISNLVFMIAPRVNAAGRMDDARKAVQMFIAPSYQEAFNFAQKLHVDNDDRRVADKEITEEALKMINENASLLSKKSTVLYQSHWHKGVVGIVASRLIDHFYRPTIVLTKSGDYVAGSARSVAGFNVYEAIHQCKDLLIGYGGHFYAAGMTMHTDNVTAFQQRFEEVVASSITPDLLIPEIVVDAEVQFHELSQKFYDIIHRMEPFGPDNPKPVFISRNCVDKGSRLVKEQHIRFLLQQNNVTVNGIGFCLGEKFHLLEQNEPLDIVFTLEENEWKNTKQLQLRVIDVRLSNKKAPEDPGLAN